MVLEKASLAVGNTMKKLKHDFIIIAFLDIQPQVHTIAGISTGNKRASYRLASTILRMNAAAKTTLLNIGAI